MSEQSPCCIVGMSNACSNKCRVFEWKPGHLWPCLACISFRWAKGTKHKDARHPADYEPSCTALLLSPLPPPPQT